MNNKLNILVTIDDNYLEPLEVMLFSLYRNNPNQEATIWLIHENISEESLVRLTEYLKKMNWYLESMRVKDDFFSDAPTDERYPKEMYFRLLCGEILPKELKQVLYLDPDILVINSVMDLWELNLEGHLIAASSHGGITNISAGINNIRLNLDHNYYNSGIMLIDLEKARELISLEDINQTIEKFGNLLLLPDQDVLNHLYGKYILEIPEEIWNYDTRKYLSYLAKSKIGYDISWVMENTVFLHFCGKLKPWQKKSETKFTALYLDYARHKNIFNKKN